MTTPTADQLRTTFGYHPVVTALPGLLGAGSFDELLVFGAGLGDVVDLVGETRVVTTPPVQLPQGIYWFAGVSPTSVLLVSQGAPATGAMSVPAKQVAEGSALDNALGWVEQEWTAATPVPRPLFAVGQDVLVDGTGQDGVVRPNRRFIAGRWSYQVFSAGQQLRRDEDSISARPTVDDPATWVTTTPERPSRFAATLSRAKLDGHFTDTMFSFRATRTIFRPYQFKPVQKLLNTNALRLLIADEVGLGKTIEAGLVWTELEARRQADRVLVVCPSALVSKWRREMEERFGFELVELDTEKLEDLVERLETDRVPRRAAYISSIERLRVWSGLERASELGLDFDLAIVDEAHAFRNSDTKSHNLGELLSEWAEALIMLSATPVNLRNRDLFNLLGILVPDEFDDLESLEERLSPNRVLNRITKSLLDPEVSNRERSSWLDELESDLFGRVLMQRPDFKLLRAILSASQLDAAAAVQVKRLCAELHGLSGEVTRTRKVEVQEEKPLREPHRIEVVFDASEAAFYEAFADWCRHRAAVTGSPLNFAMQMPLRLAGSCLPEAARSVLEWDGFDSLEIEDGAVPPAKSAAVPPSAQLVALARALVSDTKFDQFSTALADLTRQEKRTIVFTFSRRTLRYLQGRLSSDFRVGMLHGGVPKKARDAVMADFRAGRFDVLLASKVASEGLDFEFCAAVVNYDLPWNPMEVEQRIGRIDRIGQVEKKIAVLNFSTPGTIEADIIERVMDRIGVFEHAIGELEPILESEWKAVEKLLFDFDLSREQRERRSNEMILALEEQAQALEEIESAAPMLISSDGAEIDGLERDLLATGRYVGQAELGLLVADWAETFGGRVERDQDVLRVQGNEEMADHVRSLVRTGERREAEVSEVAAQLRTEQTITLSLDQEMSRMSGLELLTATHPLTRAASSTPGYKQGRFTLLRMDAEAAGVPAGGYLTLLTVVKWDGIRPLHEVWSSTVDLDTMADMGEPLGLAVMKELAQARLKAGPLRDHANLQDAVEQATINLEVRVAGRQDSLREENAAFVSMRRVSFEQVHRRRMRRLRDLLQTHVERGNKRVIPATRARIAKQEDRFASQNNGLDRKSTPSLSRDDLAVCVIEVLP